MHGNWTCLHPRGLVSGDEAAQLRPKLEAMVQPGPNLQPFRICFTKVTLSETLPPSITNGDKVDFDRHVPLSLGGHLAENTIIFTHS